MRKAKKTLPLILGVVLVVCGLCGLLAFHLRGELGVRECQKTVEKMEQLLPERTPGVPGSYVHTAMPVLQIDGKDHVAIVEIPAYGIRLPVAADWDAEGLYASPSRFYGSAYDHSLVIGGADHPRQFGFCDQIDIGAMVTVTDMTGAVFSYKVVTVERAEHAQSRWLLSEEYDLTLFCRDSGSMKYVAVRCVSTAK